MSQDSRARLEERNRELKRMRKEYMTRFYREAVEAASRKRPIVHTTALGPTEIFNAMGLYPVIAENYVTITCAKQEAKGFCETAEQRGFSNDLCSYFRCGLGMMYRQGRAHGRHAGPQSGGGNDRRLRSLCQVVGNVGHGIRCPILPVGHAFQFDWASCRITNWNGW